jgi:putative DNA primase/helicase
VERIFMSADDFRVERDSMGEIRVPSQALWGAQTQRAVQNFAISGLVMPRGFIRALGLVKWAAAGANVELGELDATFRKSDIAQLKSFLTRDRDVIRRAYARLESNYARRTVFFASVNPKEFLHDPTGNRRYWTIECEDINHSHDMDMQQVWAQVYMLYLSGQSWFLTPEEMATLNDANKSFEVVDPIAERIRTKLAWDDSPMLWKWKTATDILIEIGIDKPTQTDATRAANVIRALNGNQGKRVGTGRLLLAPDKIYGT